MKEKLDKKNDQILDFIKENKIVNLSFISYIIFYSTNSNNDYISKPNNKRVKFENLPSDIKHDNIFFYRMEFHLKTQKKKKSSQKKKDLVITHNLTTNMTPHICIWFIFVCYVSY